MANPPRDQAEIDRIAEQYFLRETTPRPGEPRLNPTRDTPLPLRTRFEIIISLALTAWGFVMVAIAVCSKL